MIINHIPFVFLQDEQEKLKAKLPALAVQGNEKGSPTVSADKAISAIEAKLMAMEKDEMSFSVSCPGKASSSKGQGQAKVFNKSQNNKYRPYNQPTRKPYSSSR